MSDIWKKVVEEGDFKMKPDWPLKRDAEQHPVRFLAGQWQKRMKENFGVTIQLMPKELGQLKSLRKALGDLSLDVIEWMLDPVNWWHFCRQVRSDSGSHRAPDYPHVGYLLAHHRIGLKIMRSRLHDSSSVGDFVWRVDQRHYEQMKMLVLVLAEKKPEQLAKVEAAKTLIDIQRVFIEIVDATQLIQ
jgi:hypothetical protein